MLSDRIKIMRGGGHGGADVQLSPQPLLDCGAPGNENQQNVSIGTCEGGHELLAYDWLSQHGVTDRTCSPYRAMDGNCLHELSFCRVCYITGECNAVPNATRYYVDDWGRIADPESNVTAMMREIRARGPIACRVNADALQFSCYRGGVIVNAPNGSEPAIAPPTARSLRLARRYDAVSSSRGALPWPCVGTGADQLCADHVISVLGWGTTDEGVDYWIARHSGGRYWGEDGFFRIERGRDALLIERYCSWATVREPLPDVDTGNAKICTD